MCPFCKWLQQILISPLPAFYQYMDGRADVHVQPHFFMFIHRQRVLDESPSLTVPVTSRLVLVLCLILYLTLRLTRFYCCWTIRSINFHMPDLDFQYKHIEYIQTTCFFNPIWCNQVYLIYHTWFSKQAKSNRDTIGLIDSHVDINLIRSPTQWPQQHNTASLFNPHFS